MGAPDGDEDGRNTESVHTYQGKKINYNFYCTIIYYDDPMLRKWTKIFRRTKQDITKGKRRTYWPTTDRPNPLQTRNFGPRIEPESHPEKTNLLTKRNCEEVAAVECEYPQPECLPTLNLLPSVDLFQVFRYCCSAAWWTFATGEIALNTEAKCRDPRHDTLHDFVWLLLH